MLNLYGSSEVAADVTCQEVGEADCAASSISIGRPISNTQIYILDEQGNPVPVGVRGEIYVGGAGLARGYWRRPELTAERFVANPFAAIGSAAASSSRLFRTGDAGRFRSTGEIEYAGRMDNQVKLRGMRMELGEIEAVLRSHPRVGEGMVAVGGEGEQAGLVAYVMFAEAEKEKEQGVAGAGELRRYMRSKLPEHMVPRASGSRTLAAVAERESRSASGSGDGDGAAGGRRELGGAADGSGTQAGGDLGRVVEGAADWH